MRDRTGGVRELAGLGLLGGAVLMVIAAAGWLREEAGTFRPIGKDDPEHVRACPICRHPNRFRAAHAARRWVIVAKRSDAEVGPPRWDD